MLVKACAGSRSYRKGEKGVRHMGEFGCESCGSPAVELPVPSASTRLSCVADAAGLSGLGSRSRQWLAKRSKPPNVDQVMRLGGSPLIRFRSTLPTPLAGSNSARASSDYREPQALHA
jgi:hypothetical protein